MIIFKQAAEGIKEISKSCRRWPGVRETLLLLAFTSMGLVGNYLNIELFFGVNFIFGSIATMLAVRMSGTLWGTLVGIVIGSYTYVLWGHPYAIIIFGLEAFVVGFIVCFLKRDDMILIDAVYWLLVGTPLVWVFYSYQLGLPEPAVTLIALKQMANGITNVVLASLIFQFTPLMRWIRLKEFSDARESTSIYAAINTLLAIFTLLPMLGATILSAQSALEEIQQNLQHTIIDKAKQTGRELGSILNYYSTVFASMVEIELNESNRVSWKSRVRNLGENIIPGLLNTEIINAGGEILFSYPKQRTGISQYAKQLSTVKPNSNYLSSVHVGDDIDGPHFTMILPISGGRFIAGSFSLNFFEEQLTLISGDKLHIELIDGQGTIVASSGTKDLSGFVQGINPHHLLPVNTDLPIMVRWRQAYWEDTTVFMGDNGWTMRMAAPMEKSIELLESDYNQKLLTMLVISLVALLLVPLVSRAILSPIKDLTLAAGMYTKSIERIDVIWPTSNMIEINSLVGQFQTFIHVINTNQLALSRSEAQFSGIANDLMELIDTANAPIFGIDADGKVNEWNQQAEKITGYKKEEVIGQGLVADFITDDYKLSVGEILEKALKGEETANYEFPLFTKSGDRVDVLLNSTTRRDAFGQIVGVVGVGQDITELNQVRVEQERERKKAAAQIIQTSKLTTLGEMSTSVAHELNQPLNIIRMAAGNSRRNLSNGTADPEYLNDKLERIEEQAARAAAIIGHMRMFGREVKEHPKPIDPRNVVSNALDLMGEQLRLAGIEIVTELAEDCPSILGHTIELEQVILNLLTNASDAMAESDGEMRVILRVFKDDKGVHITSEDSGGGIPEDVLPRIFEPFYTTKEIGKGTGLGLSVSYGIIREMNGTIVAENTGDGARFTITLPAVG
jgi:PAS domain S-box-containing protein